MERMGARGGGPKNLRAISLALVAKVRRVRVTTSTALANELAREAIAEADGSATKTPGARAALEKNVRRRLYDSLKVLVSVGAIARSRRDKTLRWNGTAHLRRAARSCGGSVARIIAAARTRLSVKAARLRAQAAQVAAVRTLCARNRARATAGVTREQRLYPPFVVMRAPCAAKIEMDSSAEETSLTFSLNERFEIVNDSGILHMLFLVERLDPPAPPAGIAGSSRRRAYAPPPASVLPVGIVGCQHPSLAQPLASEGVNGTDEFETASPGPQARSHMGLRPELEIDLDIVNEHEEEHELWELSS